MICLPQSHIGISLLDNRPYTLMLMHRTVETEHDPPRVTYERLPGWKIHWMVFQRERLPGWVQVRVMKTRAVTYEPRAPGARVGGDCSLVALVIALLLVTVLMVLALWPSSSATLGQHTNKAQRAAR